MTEREKKLFDILNTIAYDSKLASCGGCGYNDDVYEVECSDIQAARDLIREIEQEEEDAQA